ncbi:MAG: hypothetical protein HC945_00395 [Nitrosarchaeum sp.]|nr:hypothetical protein [Nitrosarchaeum sp.]
MRSGQEEEQETFAQRKKLERPHRGKEMRPQRKTHPEGRAYREQPERKQPERKQLERKQTKEDRHVRRGVPVRENGAC